MRIFINSCGYSRQDPAHEYRWKSLSEDFPGYAFEELERKRFGTLALNDLIQTDSRQPSVVLARSGDDIIFWATRIASEKRTGSQGDPVYDSVLIVGKNHHLTLFRRTAANIIASVRPSESDFTGSNAIIEHECVIGQLLDELVHFDDEAGFQIDSSVDFAAELEYRLETRYGGIPMQQEGFLWRPKFGHNCYKLRQELAYELVHFSLPMSQGPLIIVTGVKNPYFAVRSECWRTLTHLAEGVNWQALPVKKEVLRRRDRLEASLGSWSTPKSRVSSIIALGNMMGWQKEHEPVE